MRILFIYHDRPNYYAGPIVNARRLLPGLQKSGFEVHCLIFVIEGLLIITLVLSVFSIITLDASISSWEIPICFITCCIFFGLIPGNILT